MKLEAATTPYWSDSAAITRYPKLDRDLDVDVAIVGGGITGVTAAYLLTLEGSRVALIERERLAYVDTGHTSAHLTLVTDLRFTDLVNSFGRERAIAVWDAGVAALARISDIVHDEAIDCDFAWVPAYLHAPLDDRDPNSATVLRNEAAAASEAGFDAQFVEDVLLVGGPGVRFADQARFHPRKYVGGLAQLAAANGGLIFEHTSADEFSDDPLSIKAGNHTIRCREIVLATHNPLMGNTGLVRATAFQTKLALYTTYVVAGRVPKGRVPDALLWDTADPYHYLRLEPHRDFDIVILGGEDHKTGQARDTRECFDALERTLTAAVRDVEITHRWSGQVIATPDGLPYIGETAPHQFAATGFAGNGLTFGTLAAMMAADRALGRQNPWSDLFDPGRVKLLGGAWDYVRENIDYPYYMIRDRVARMTGAKAKDTPVCTHMGCLVDWNEAENTWDCPCHGSRFKADGSIVSGPAESPLDVE